jgi:hypothetical protein
VLLGRGAELPDLTYQLLVPFVGEAAARDAQRDAAGLTG